MRFQGHRRRRQEDDGYSNNKRSNGSNTHPLKSAILIPAEVRPQVGSAELSAGLSAGLSAKLSGAGPSTGANFFSCEGKMLLLDQSHQSRMIRLQISRMLRPAEHAARCRSCAVLGRA